MIVLVIFLVILVGFYVFFKTAPWVLAIMLGLSVFGGYKGIRLLQDGIKTIDYPDPDVKGGRKKIIAAALILIVSIVVCVLSVRGFAFFIQ